VPQPPESTWFREFRRALVFRGWALRVAIPILAMIVFGVAVVVIAEANSGAGGPAPAASSLGFPPAALAGGQFTAAASGRGISQVMGRVASDGGEIVAVGSQSGARIGRAQFFVSLDNGLSWALGSVRAPGGGPPPPGHAARLVAGGRGAWVAVGADAIWTSGDGRTWTLASTAGLPLLPGDQVNVLKRTADGFIAAGANTRDSSPVLFRSANGTSWQRAQPRLAAGTGRALDIRYAAAAGNLILIAGDVATAASRAGAAWLSRDGGATWLPARVPAGHGAQPQITGAAPAGNGFVLVRPARAGGTTAADVYRSPDGATWTFAATLTAQAGFASGMVNGGPAGAVVTGQTGAGALIAFVSANAIDWRRTAAFGSAASQSISGVSLIEGGAVITGTAPAPASRQPLVTLVPAHGHPVHIDVTRIPGAFDPQLAVNAIAAADGALVAVGSANGFPAAWISADGGSSWTRASGRAPAVFTRPGVQLLSGVTHGAAGWLAVGGGAAGHPVVLVSANGRTWQAADGQGAFGGNGLFTVQAASKAGRYVIVGYTDLGQGRSAAAWWSAAPAARNGWQRAPAAGPAAQGTQGAQGTQMLAVTAGPSGFVAAGSHGNQAAAWTSPDGTTWTREDLPVPAGYARTVLQHVASNGRTVVAAGAALTRDGRTLPFAAVSSDGGATWAQSTLPVPSGQAAVTALAATGKGFTATGTFGGTQGHQDVVVWTSATGSGWRAATPGGEGLAGPGVQAITALTVAGSTLTGVGFTASPTAEQPTFWQSPIR
jgi:hypothetical protein